MERYGLKNPDGTANKSRKDHISAAVVSVLQAGAFFGALTSAPISGTFVQFNETRIGLDSHYRYANSLLWKEENPSSILHYLLGRCCECYGYSIHSKADMKVSPLRL